MTVILNHEQEQIVHSLLQSGHYESIDNVIDEALCLLKDRERYSSWGPTDEDKLRQTLANAIAQADRGKCLPLDMDAIKQKGREVLGKTNGTGF